MPPGALPVGKKLVAVHRGSFGDETEWPGGEGPAEDLAVDADGSGVFAVLGVEVGDGVGRARSSTS